MPPKKDTSSEDQNTTRDVGKNLGLTEKQEKSLAELSLEQREKYKEAFSNKVTSTVCKTEDALKEHPVVMMLLKANTNLGSLIGTLIDLAFDTSYITNHAADRLRLHRETIKLVVHGIGGMKKTAVTKRYSLLLKVKTPKGKVAEHGLWVGEYSNSRNSSLMSPTMSWSVQQKSTS